MSKDLTEALWDMMRNAPGYNPPSDPNKPKLRGAEPGQKSAAALPIPPKGGGSASPFTETNFADRQFHTQVYKTSDGLFTMPAIKKIVMTDANSDPVEMIFAPPS